MSVPELRAVLAGLCCGHGWSYALVWSFDKCDPRLLVVEDVYCDEQVQGVVQKIGSQVHIVGEGILGRALISGKDRWIFHDTYQAEFRTASDADNQGFGQGDVEWMYEQFNGFKTIVLCTLPSFGLVQFGSTTKIPESLDFIAQAKVFLGLKFSNSESHHVAKCTSTYFTREYDYSFENKSPQSLNYEYLSNLASLGRIAQSSGKLLDEFHSASRYDNMNLSSHEITVPVTSCMPSFGNQFQKQGSCASSMFHLPDQINTNNGEFEVLVSSGTELLSTFSLPENTVMLPSGIGISCISNLMPLSSFERVSSQFSAESSSSSMQQTSQYPILDARYSGHSKSRFSNEQKILLQQGHPSAPNILFHEPSFASEHKNTRASNLKNSTPEHSSFGSYIDGLTHRSFQQLSQTENNTIPGRSSQVITASPGSAENAVQFSMMGNGLPRLNDMNMSSQPVSSMSFMNDNKESSLISSTQLFPDNSSFDWRDLDLNPSKFLQDYWEDIMMHNSCSNPASGASEFHKSSVMASEEETFLDSGAALPDAIGGENAETTSIDNYIVENLHSVAGLCLQEQLSMVSSHLDGHSVSNNKVGGGALKMSTSCKPEAVQGYRKEALSKSIAGSKTDDTCSGSTANSLLNQPKKPEEIPKVVKKRARSGESSRPRPKDRQQIQDRVRELREIVPNGAKCSIDALLDRTIKHMLFLQSVTKYADKLKQADEPEMFVEESGVVLKDNSGSGAGGGATWAYEVAGQTMVCPIIVEDLSPPGQMLVEMLCEERGFFLEIADIIRGFGLIILKGMMEMRACKIWARFFVEANKDVTRMDIFLSLVQLLHQTSVGSCEQETRVVEKGTLSFGSCKQSSTSVPVIHSDKLR